MVRVVDGVLKKGQKVRFMATGRDYEVTEIGVFSPHPTALTELGAGEVGFIAGNIKSVRHQDRRHRDRRGQARDRRRCPASRT
jgi:translation elongation factor EF-4